MVTKERDFRMEKHGSAFLANIFHRRRNLSEGVLEVGAISAHAFHSFETRGVFISIHRRHLVTACGNRPVIILHKV